MMCPDCGIDDHVLDTQIADLRAQLAAVTAERDAALARAEKAEHTLLHSSVSGYLARCVELESALSEAAARNGVLRDALEWANRRGGMGLNTHDRFDTALSTPAVVDPRVEALVDALRWYGHHSSGCYQEGRECCCGLDGAITAWGRR